ncbi:hypothetical protein [Variovorax guangxiensis]|uniref:hypothetical protein n=1 Tax=Variovorax guangxiensis TaxID=1775474 RepID=UPI00286152D5|nr:hypothetical protein [Variovorax guangxiensis]MDR6857286.1 hypothetical protein [Variovorax guangxiensis]
MRSTSRSTPARINVSQSNFGAPWRKNALSKEKYASLPVAVTNYVESGKFNLQAVTWAIENNESEFFGSFLTKKTHRTQRKKK